LALWETVNVLMYSGEHCCLVQLLTGYTEVGYNDDLCIVIIPTYRYPKERQDLLNKLRLLAKRCCKHCLLGSWNDSCSGCALCL